MITSVRFARSATIALGVISLLVTAPAGAQRSTGRMGVAAPPPVNPSSRMGVPSVTGGVTNLPRIDPRVQSNRPIINPNRRFVNRRFRQNSRQNFFGSSIPFAPFGGFGYYNDCGGCVFDANGAPLTQTFEEMQSPPPSATYYGVGYTPDLSGSPYAISEEGMMVVEFANGVRRAFPSCAQQGDLRDPQGRPRTIFYHQTDYWMVLRPGQRGRVRGDPPAANAKSCYAIDATGNVVLRQ